MSGRSLLFECYSGISGDMAVAALLDLGADQGVLLDALDSLPIGGFSVEIGRAVKGGVDCCNFNVILDEKHENRDHDMEYLFGHEHGGETELASHAHEDEHRHGHTHHHEHRRLQEIFAVIDEGKMREGARRLAKKIFTVLAESEAKVHGTSAENVAFHEVGAVDSIVDIIAFAVCFDSLEIKKVYIPYLCEGTGTVRCRHGILPVPVPAVAETALRYGIPLQIIPERGEFVTPTGAAIAAAVADEYARPTLMKVVKIGNGAGKRTYRRPSFLRAFIIEENSHSENERIIQMETDIDNTAGEAVGFTAERLFEAGALDVCTIPCYMKKNRPGFLLKILCRREQVAAMEEILFTHTNTIGVRRFETERSVLKRKALVIPSAYGDIKGKTTEFAGETRFSPEYESVAEVCRRTGKRFGDVYEELTGLFRKAETE